MTSGNGVVFNLDSGKAPSHEDQWVIAQSLLCSCTEESIIFEETFIPKIWIKLWGLVRKYQKKKKKNRSIKSEWILLFSGMFYLLSFP